MHDRVQPADLPPPLQLWGGVECTLNRVGDAFGDQLALTGHAERQGDLDLIGGIGFSAIRYPVLWEHVAPDDPATRDWTWSDDRLGHLQAAGQRVIAGLVHHGSGPRYTHLLDPAFATGLADHARAVAERYPFIEEWTPVNEPLTTARFSALYGHWYPHADDEESFWCALLNQIDATRLAMRAVRAVNPGARLIQTDDLGRTYATAPLRDQAAFDNVRRWMAWDLLCGMVKPGHDLWRRLCGFGLRSRLDAIADDPCPPDVIGINHYLTSDRFLDHRIRRYPRGDAGGNGMRAFVDTEAVRVLAPPPPGIGALLRETWDRYGLPLAITEVHNGCTREEQMRWLWRIWQEATRARAEGIDVRAVTCWALFGSMGWNTLLTGEGRYEPGVFDVSGDHPRPTAMVPLLRSITRGAEPTHPVLRGSGWWQRDIRLHHPVVPRPAPMREHGPAAARLAPHGSPILIAGGEGTLGRALAAACAHRHLSCVALGRRELNLLDPGQIAMVLDHHRPWAVINAAGWVRVDDAEENEAACLAANADAAALLAGACASRGIATVGFSSDLVFDGCSPRRYDETDAPAPMNVYGRSKVAAEQAIVGMAGRHLMVRTAAFFSPFDVHNFAVHACAALRAGRRFDAADDQVVTPTYVPDLCNAVLDLVIDGEQGLWHLTNGDACSWTDFARRVAAAAGLDAGLVDGRSGAELGWRAPRPRHVPLRSRRGRLLPPLADAIARFARDLAPRWKEPDALTPGAAAASGTRRATEAERTGATLPRFA